MHLVENDEYKSVPQELLDQTFLTLSDPILAGLTINDLSDLSWIVWTGIFPLCSIETVTKVNH